MDISFWHINAILAFLISCVIAGILIPKIILIAFRKNLFDVRDERKIHYGKVPRLGGIAFAPVIFFCVAFLLLLNLKYGDHRILTEFRTVVLPFSALTCSMILMYIIGIADDLIGVRYPAKFAFQIACGLLFIIAGISIVDFKGLFFLDEIPTWLSYLTTLFLFVFIVNAVNLIDGIDGLASGLSGVALIFYGMLFLYYGEYTYALLAFATLGTVVPFFYYNVFGKEEKQKKIFMGDTGTLTIGTLLCFFSIKIADVGAATGETCHPIALAIAPILVPCMDVIRVFIHRVRNGNSPFLPDANHIHHKLLKMGISQRKAMITIVVSSMITTVFCVALSYYINVTWVLLLCISLYTLLNIFLSKIINKD